MTGAQIRILAVLGTIVALMAVFTAVVFALDSGADETNTTQAVATTVGQTATPERTASPTPTRTATAPATPTGETSTPTPVTTATRAPTVVLTTPVPATPTAVATPIATVTRAPTAVPTQAPTVAPTRAPTAVPTPAVPGGVVVRAPEAANIRSGPSTDYAAIGTLGAGESATATGRTVDESWLRLTTGGWIARTVVQVLSGSPAALPVVPAPPLPTAVATPVRTAVAGTAVQPVVTPTPVR